MPISFKWLVNNKKLAQNFGINIGSFGKKTSVLGIETISEKHAGNYTCIAENRAGSSSYSAELIVKGTFTCFFLFVILLFTSAFSQSLKKTQILCRFLVLPHITPFDFEEQFNTGDSAQLTCYVGKGDVPLRITWYHKNEKILPGSGITTITIGERTNLLSVSALQPKHSGEYLCVATNRAGTAKHSATLYIAGNHLTNALHMLPLALRVLFAFYFT